VEHQVGQGHARANGDEDQDRSGMPVDLGVVVRVNVIRDPDELTHLAGPSTTP
jgi:hypothetical protein